jgi:hypothetical protein
MALAIEECINIIIAFMMLKYQPNFTIDVEACFVLKANIWLAFYLHTLL